MFFFVKLIKEFFKAKANKYLIIKKKKNIVNCYKMNIYNISFKFIIFKKNFFNEFT